MASDENLVLKVTKAKAQKTREFLENRGIFDATRKVKQDGDHLLLPITEKTEGDVLTDLNRENHCKTNLNTKIQNLAEDFLENSWRPELSCDLPKHWEKHDDLIIFPINAFQDPIWNSIKIEFWTELSRILQVQRLAKKSVISNDDFRSPKIQMLLGQNTWATKKENGIYYTWNITKSMFSVGNITEKQRIAQFQCKGQTIVDLFAGVGYFTLTYLIHSKADFVYACEWNPEAVKALKLNLAKNKVQDKCQVFAGDNRDTCPQGVADHVNLGLLPTAEMSYSVACKALKDSGGVLHIHANVKMENQQSWADQTQVRIQDILGPAWTTEQILIFPVKSFAPKVQHLVLDLKCVPK